MACSADMKNQDPLGDSLDRESPKLSADEKAPERIETNRQAPLAPGNVARARLRVAGRLLGSLLLGGVAILGPILIFRQGLLPLIEAGFHPGPEWLSVLRRAGILLTAVAGYWAFVHWHEKRAATELHLRPMHLLLGGASGAAMVALPMAVLFALGVYELVLFRGASPALLGVAALIGIAALLEELVYRCLLFRLLERALGNNVGVVRTSGGVCPAALGKRRKRRDQRCGDHAVAVSLGACSGLRCSSWHATCGSWPPIMRLGTSPFCSLACRFPALKTGANWRHSKAALPGPTG